jgi:hypothetical protein
LTNALDLPHAFVIPGMVDTGPIPPGDTVSVTFAAGAPGSYLYFDDLNAPVNRVMGLHGAFIVMPRAASPGQALTPYGTLAPNHPVQQLFNDFGRTAWWPGLAWGAGDAATEVAAARQYVWLAHQASPVLFDEVGALGMGPNAEEYDPDEFLEAFTNDPFLNTSNDPRTGTSADFPAKTEEFNRKPHFFTINGQSGFFAHHNPAITPFHRVGEPCVIRILNAGLYTHSMHLHANHFFVASINNVPQDNPLWVDVFQIFPMDAVDYVIPLMRPPDIPNVRGIGRADAGLPTAFGALTWPPTEELLRQFPSIADGINVTGLDGQPHTLVMNQSPLCYPMHDHSEPTQTAQGGNYNCGSIAGLYIMGDRNTAGALNFTIDAEFEHMLGFGKRSGQTGPPTGGWPPEGDIPA